MSDVLTQVTELSPERQQLLSLLLEQKSTELNSFPLSFAQQRLWFLYKLEPDSPAYNLAAAVRLNGSLNEPALKRGLQEILRRHEALRTTFAEVNGQAVQLIHPGGDVVLMVHDLEGLEVSEQNIRVQKLAAEEAERPFDLVHGPLLRTRLLRLGPTEHIFLVAMHHIISDGWSVGILVRELASLYEAFSKGKSSPLPQLPIQYADFAQWQRERLRGEILEQQLAYWIPQLHGAPGILELPTDRPRPAVQTFRGAVQSFLFPKKVAAKLNALSHREGCTLFMTLLAAFKVLLYRYTAQEDLLVGTPIANRNQVETEGLIGLFVNTLVLRTSLSGNPTFLELLHRVREVTLDAYAYQDVPFEKLMEELQPVRSLSHAPFFQVMFVLQNTPAETLNLSGLDASILELDNRTSKFDLTLFMEDTDQGLTGSFEYNSDLFDAPTISRMVGHLQTLLDGIVRNPDQLIYTLPLLTQAERQQLLIDFNDTARESLTDQCVHQMFEAQVDETPDAIAATYEEQQLTFEELNSRANQLAHSLRSLGVGPNVLVGVCVERSLETIVGILGVLKAGGAYVPMDPAYPRERLAFMLEDTRARIVLTQQRLVSRLPAEATQVICLDRSLPESPFGGQFAEEHPASGVTLDSLAYVIYTSGSTGQPKGILIPHRGLTNYLSWCTSAYKVEEGEGAPVHSSLSFDLTITALFAPLLVGRKVELLPESPGIENLSTAAESRRNFSLIKITPLHLELLRHQLSPQQAAGLTRTFVIGGENLLAENLAFWQDAAPDTVLVNEYGPTETVVGCCVYRQPHGSPRTGSVPIGRPIANTQLYVLDRNLQPVPVGVPGELFIGGLGLAWGYLNRPDLTAEKFIPNPFGSAPDARLYRTGDLARHLPDGNLEYLGRIDHQVKIRGYRIELGEIESILGQHPAVREAVAIAREDTPGDRRVVAYIVPRQSHAATPDDLHDFLKDKLPHYMLPAALVVLDALPFTSNGKVDRGRLPIPEIATRREVKDALVAPRSPSEALLARIWADVLHLDQVGIHDNFFELGGDSILSIQVIAKSSQAGLHLTPKQLFQHQTIAELAKVVAASSIEAQQDPVVGLLPLTPVQRWFFEQNFTDPHHWNQSLLLEVDPSLSASHLERALRHLILHHDALRLRFEQTASGWEQEIIAPGDAEPFSRVDLSILSEAKQACAIEAEMAESQASLDLSRGPVLRATFFDLGPEKPARLSLIVHHLAVDGVSWRILLEDLQTLCREISRGEKPHLPAKTSSFKEWAERLTQYATSEPVQREVDYWLANGHSPVPCLPVDHVGGRNTEASVRSVSVSLSADETRALLQDVPRTYHTQINDVLLTALAFACRRWTGASSLLVDLEGHGREAIFEDVDLSRTVGWFTTIFPMRLNLESSVSNPAEALQSVKRQRDRIPNGGIGYGLLRYLNDGLEIPDKLRALPQADIIFNYLGQIDQLMDNDSLFRPASTNSGQDHSLSAQRSHLLEINAQIAGGKLSLEWLYSQNVHRESTVASVAEGFVEALRSLIGQCQSPVSGRCTPSDFPLVELNQSQLDAVVAEICPATDHTSPEQIDDIYPLSSTQQGLLFHSLCAPQSGAYFEQLTAIMEGDLDVPAFERAWQCVVDRQPVLRTAFVWEGLKDPVQAVRRHASLAIEQDDWRGLDEEEQRQRLELFLERDRTRGFNLSLAPLARLALMRLREDSHRFTLSFHHLLLDGWSVPLLFREFFAFYEAFRNGESIELELSRPYRDYLDWLRQQDSSPLEAYWRQTLKGITTPTRLGSVRDDSPAFQTQERHTGGRLSGSRNPQPLLCSRWRAGAILRSTP